MTMVAAAPIVVCLAISFSSVPVVNKGTSPDSRMSVPVAPFNARSVVSRACAVPSCGSWTTKDKSVRLARAAFNSSA